MRHNQTLTHLRHQKPTVGLWLQTHSFHIARMITGQNLFNWLLVDMEHTPIDLYTASTIFSAIADISGGACTPLARLANGTIDQIKQALDAGAQGIIVPMVNTAEDAAQVVRFARYPPLGERGGGGLFPHFGFGLTSHIEYIQNANAEIMVGIQIETQQAVSEIDAIVNTPGIDLVFIGPFDLHISLGLPPSLWSDNPVFLAAVGKVIKACKEHGLPYGTIAPNAAGVRDRLADGFTFVSMGTDLGQLLNTLHAQTKEMKTRIVNQSE